MSQTRDVFHVTAFISALNSPVASSSGSGSLRFWDDNPFRDTLRIILKFWWEKMIVWISLSLLKHLVHLLARLSKGKVRKPDPCSVSFSRPVDAF